MPANAGSPGAGAPGTAAPGRTPHDGPAPRNLHLGRLGLGTAPLAGLYRPVDDRTAAGALEAAWSAGIRYFDTAPHYGAGVAEQRLGAFLRGHPRAEAVVSTKVGRLLRPGPGRDDAGFPDEPGLRRVLDYSREGVYRSIAESLARTGLDRFDVVLIHDPDEHWEHAVGAAYPALAQLRAEGAVSAIGAGMNQSEMLARFVRETDLDVVLVAGRCTLLDRTACAELLPLCERRQVTVVVGGVFNSGVLADPDSNPHFNYRPAEGSLLRRARELRRVCEAHGVPLPAAAVQFPFRQPGVSTVLIGARDAAEVRTDMDLATTLIPAGLWPELDRIAPPPTGECDRGSRP